MAEGLISAVASVLMTIPQDATTLVLLVIAMMPLRVRAWCITRSLSRQAPLLALALVGAAASMFMPSLPWPALAVLNAALFFGLLPVIGGGHDRTTRWLAVAGLGAFWTFQTFRNFYQTALLPDGIAHFWFVDFVNKLVLVGLAPALDLLNARPALGAVMNYLNEPVAFLSNHLLGLHLWLSIGAVHALGHILSPAHRQLRPPPNWISVTLPLWLSGGAAALVVLRTWVGEGLLWSLGRELGGGLLIVHGIGVLFGLSATSRLLRSMLWLTLFISALHPKLLWLFAVVTVADSMTSIGQRWAEHQHEVEAELQRVVSILRRRFGPAVVMLTLLPLLLIPYVPLAFGEAPDDQAPHPFSPAPVEATVVPVPGSARVIDRLEFPNEAGATPTTGLGPRAAEAMCERQGKVLCDSDAWYEACSAGGHHFYVIPSRPYQRSILERMRATCNIYNPERMRGLKPAGAMARCTGPVKALDMAGNAFEWVRMPELDGYWGLAGGYYGYADAQTPSCGFRVVIHPRQLPILETEAIGFRCCSPSKTGK